MREWRRGLPLLISALLLALPAPGQERWPQEGWNPKPQPDDLVLPLPCGGAMAFRPVPTPMGQGALADRPVTLGQADQETEYAEYLRQAFVAGPFASAGGNAAPLYYLGKYEVTRDQYAAVTAETCPALPTPAGRQPQAEVSWQEAASFANRLSSWLLRNARDALPQREEAVAFLRLPTEEEWEYAARGGAAVAEADFAARSYPMPDGMQRHVWFQGTRSARGQTHPVGLLEANPLGLHDMLGNVAEWVLEPYRLNKVGRPHGMAGGLVARGGDFQTSEAQIRSSLRVELPPMNLRTGEPLRLRTVGFRLALGLVANTSDARPGSFREAFEAEARSRTTAAEDPGRLLTVLRQEAADPAMRQGLERVEARLRAAARAQAEQEALTLRSQVETAASLARQVYLANGNQVIFRAVADAQRETARFLAESTTLRGNPALDGFVRTAQGIEAALRKRADEDAPRASRQAVASYLRVVAAINRGGDAGRIAEATGIVAEELRAQGLPGLPELAQLVGRHAAARALPSPEAAERDIMAAVPNSAPPQGR